MTAAAELMRHKGYGAFSMKDVVEASGAPIGSLYHHFPGGKTQLAREALVNAGVAYGLLIPALMNSHDDLGAAIEHALTQAAHDMHATGFANMCPIGSVASEIADTVEELRVTTAEIFTAWFDGATAYLCARGVPEGVARDAAVALVGTLEGAFTLARTLRCTEPLMAVGRVLGAQFRGVALRKAVQSR